MKVKVTKPTEINVKQINIFLKIRDEFFCELLDENGNKVFEYEGYVPSIVPGEFGDYLDLKIDIDTGQILNWYKLKPNEVQEFMEKNSD